MQVFVLILGLSVFVSLFANAGLKLFIWLRPLLSGVSPLIYGIAYGAVVVAVLGSFVISRIPDNGLPHILIAAGHYMLGFLVYLVMLVNIVDLLLFLGQIIRLFPGSLPSQVMLAAGGMIILVAAGVSVYGAVHGLAIQTRSYEVQLRQAEGTDEGDILQIALISDLHLGYIVDGKHLEKIVTAVNAASPDIVCIAGDIFDGDITSLEDDSKVQRLFGEFRAPYGVYACLGNHDAGPGYEQMQEFLSGAGVSVLQDEAVVIDGRFVLAGRRDSSPIGSQGDRRTELTLPAQAENLPVIVLDHQPGNIGEYDAGTDLILCGHTHRGQMFPFNLVTSAAFDVDYGYYQRPEDGVQVVVTSGAGTWGPPQRVATDNEIVMIRAALPAAGPAEMN